MCKPTTMADKKLSKAAQHDPFTFFFDAEKSRDYVALMHDIVSEFGVPSGNPVKCPVHIHAFPVLN